MYMISLPEALEFLKIQSFNDSKIGLFPGN
jgi:hypothetical protein